MLAGDTGSHTSMSHPRSCTQQAGTRNRPVASRFRQSEDLQQRTWKRSSVAISVLYAVFVTSLPSELYSCRVYGALEPWNRMKPSAHRSSWYHWSEIGLMKS